MAQFIKISDLNQRISFKQKTVSKDEYGQAVEVFETVFSCWASIQTQYLSDLKASMGTILEGTLNFIVRYQQIMEITNDMKIEWHGKLYEIVTITKGEFKQDFTTIVAKEVQS